jgi:phage terminase small subunit
VAELTDRQKRFVAEYLIDPNQKQAAIKAGYSEKTAEQIGYQLLQKTSVAEAIAKAQEKRAKKADVTAAKVLQELADIGFDKDNERTTDRLKALELMGKHLAMFTDKVEMKATITEADVRLVEKVYERLERD